MSALALLLIGAWTFGVGYHDNSSAAVKWIGQQKGAVAWLLAVLVLWALYQLPKARPVVKPVIILAALAVFLAQWQTILKSIEAVKADFSSTATSSTASPTGTTAGIP